MYQLHWKSALSLFRSLFLSLSLLPFVAASIIRTYSFLFYGIGHHLRISQFPTSGTNFRSISIFSEFQVGACRLLLLSNYTFCSTLGSTHTHAHRCLRSQMLTLASLHSYVCSFYVVLPHLILQNNLFVSYIATRAIPPKTSVFGPCNVDRFLFTMFSDAVSADDWND